MRFFKPLPSAVKAGLDHSQILETGLDTTMVDRGETLYAENNGGQHPLHHRYPRLLLEKFKGSSASQEREHRIILEMNVKTRYHQLQIH